MYNATDATYLQARKLKRRELQLFPEDQLIVKWICDTFAVRCLDFSYETKETFKGYREQVVYIIVETMEEAARMDTPANDQLVANFFLKEFMEIDARRNRDPLKRDVHPFVDGKFPDFLICHRSLAEIELKVASNTLDKTIYGLPKEIESQIWHVNNHSPNREIFYFTEAQRMDNMDNGTNTIVSEAILQSLKRYDEFDYFKASHFGVLFLSKESFDKDFGDWYHYYR